MGAEKNKKSSLKFHFECNAPLKIVYTTAICTTLVAQQKKQPFKDIKQSVAFILHSPGVLQFSEKLMNSCF